MQLIFMKAADTNEHEILMYPAVVSAGDSFFPLSLSISLSFSHRHSSRLPPISRFKITFRRKYTRVSRINVLFVNRDALGLNLRDRSFPFASSSRHQTPNFSRNR